MRLDIHEGKSLCDICHSHETMIKRPFSSITDDMAINSEILSKPQPFYPKKCQEEKKSTRKGAPSLNNTEGISSKERIGLANGVVLSNNARTRLSPCAPSFLLREKAWAQGHTSG